MTDRPDGLIGDRPLLPRRGNADPAPVWRGSRKGSASDTGTFTPSATARSRPIPPGRRAALRPVPSAAAPRTTRSGATCLLSKVVGLLFGVESVPRRLSGDRPGAEASSGRRCPPARCAPYGIARGHGARWRCRFRRRQGRLRAVASGRNRRRAAAALPVRDSSGDGRPGPPPCRPTRAFRGPAEGWAPDPSPLRQGAATATATATAAGGRAARGPVPTPPPAVRQRVRVG